MSFRRPSPTFADLRGNVCGHCADITIFESLGRHPWRGSKTRVTDDGDKRFVACYRDPEGRQRSAGTYSSRRAAERAANREEAKVREGAWHDHSRGQVTFAEYVETVWLPSKQVETSTLAAYRSYLDKHFIPTFGRRPMGKILPSEVQRWVTTATEQRPLRRVSVGKYHTMLHSVFERALVDRVVTFNPCAHTELPKMIKKKARTLTPDRVRRDPRRAARAASADGRDRHQHRPALGRADRPQTPPPRPRPPAQLTVEETIVEVSIKNSPTGQRMLTKPYPKDNEPRTMALPADLVDQLADSITDPAPRAGDLLFATRDGTPISRNTFRTRVWLPAVKASGVDFDVRVHDLRHAHASWLLAGGSDLKSVMDRMGHAQITTTQKYLHTLPDADAQEPHRPRPHPQPSARVATSALRVGEADRPSQFKRTSTAEWTPCVPRFRGIGLRSTSHLKRRRPANATGRGHQSNRK